MRDMDPPAAAASEVARLARDLSEVVEQQAATSEVLEAIGRSAFELAPVFETVVRHAVRLCGADFGSVWGLDGNVYRLATALGGSERYRRYLGEHPIPRAPGTLVGRVWAERRTVQIADAASDPSYQWHEALELGRQRSMLGVPMLADDGVVGVIVLMRTEVDPFDARTEQIATTFAAQGAIAIRNVQLMQELRALGEVSQAVSASLEVDDEALATIVTRAVELSGGDGGSIFARQESGAFVLRACAGTSDALADALRATEIGPDTFIGRVADEGRTAQAEDLEREPADSHLDVLRRHGWRSLAAVPLLREQRSVGMLVVRRTARGLLPGPTVELLETLASHAAVTIHNARVFRELERKSQELEVASRHKSEFLASMSHELRTPLNAVIGFSEVLLDRMFGDLNERQEEYVEDIRGSGRHLLELINEILDLSKIEAGRMELEIGPVVLEDLLEGGMAMIRDRALQQGIALELHVAPGLGTVPADELKLRQVVLNLLSNAVKFTPAGGQIVVTARAEGGEAVVSVRDTGIGVAEQERERIFEAFQRGGRGARQSTEGTGLGLTLSRRILDLHGGRLWMESHVDEGSTFSFALPVAPAEPAPPEPAPVGRPGEILVVEDDRSSAELLRVYLEDAGYRVRVARDGAEGLELVKRTAPAAVILDILLPRLNGWELLARLKGDPATADVPVLIVSMLDERAAGSALGAAEYLVKPVDHEELLGALARCAAPTRS